jgi:Anti-sigma-K factor rskA, C-terminal
MAESAHCADIIELSAAVALGVAEPVDLERVEQHADECPKCAAALREFREVAAVLGASVPQVEPPARLKNRLLLTARRTPQEARVLPRARPWLRWRLAWPRLPFSPAWAVAAASMLVSVGSLVWVATLQGQVAELRTAAAAEREHAVRYDQVVQVLASPQLAVRSLTPAMQSVRSYGTVYLDPSSRTGMLTARGLPPIPSGHVWQLWFVRGNERVSGGLLWPDRLGNGYTLLQVPADVQSFEGIGVTEEPGTGSAWPTTQRIMGGSIKPESQ